MEVYSNNLGNPRNKSDNYDDLTLESGRLQMPWAKSPKAEESKILKFETFSEPITTKLNFENSK